MNLKNTLTCFLLSIFSISLSAQESLPAGSIRGIVIDVASGQALSHVTIVIPDSNPVIGTTTDNDGRFRLDNLPVGRYAVHASFIGYEPAILREILVSSVKEVFLEISLKEQVAELGEVVIRPKVNKEEPLNRMATASARMLSVEEASRYAGGFDDPARLVSAFAGVAGSMNSNSIAIRGNSPQSLQWRIEGVEAPNPTHFSDITGVGGGILTALSSQVLGNSDFFTGAFPAEYGNALSGVFDMRLRNGNNQNHEYTAQLGVLGVEFASEGPFKKGGQASYLFNYRYSSMALANDLVPDLVSDAAGMRYQDLSFKINLPTKRAGTFSLWGIGITDHFIQSVPKDTADWRNSVFEGMGDFRQTKMIGGIGHKIFINNDTYLKTSLATSYTQNQTILEQTYTDQSTFRVTDLKGNNTNVIFDTYLNRKFNAKHVNRSGINVTGLFYDADYSANSDINEYPPQPMVNFARNTGYSTLLSAYSQSSIRFGEKVTANAGIHSMYFVLNNKWTIEPRLGIKWQMSSQHAFGMAYGLHSRHENIDYYFVKTPQTGDNLVNKNLYFAKSHHLVLSYDWSISENMHLKIEPYYQYLYDVPVAKDSLLSLINYQNFYLLIPLVNDGKGRNYGVDFTLERYLHNGYYWLLTASLFESLYKGGDGVWRDTRLNRNFLINALGGKEWKLGKHKQNILGVNLRLSFQGGDRYIPIDEIASKTAQSLIYDNSRAYQAQLSPAFISHFTVSYKINKKSLAHEFAIKMVNANGYQEYSGYYYDYKINEPKMYKSAVVIPNIYYRVEF
ncbi:MAG: TonB-dependent receptor [Dysgonamonadaceae bacterium]|jgi:hypothetical protein|nr:TonB-dependent receptor [Dysgonamonadaceae bacterium]